MKILLDNGHGENTAGKRSPDGSLREYLYAREIAQEVERQLRLKGYDVERIVRENIDVKLDERSDRVNEICNECGAANVLLVSIHCNAAGMGEDWMNARGWCAYTSPGKTKADELATCLYEAAKIHLEDYTNTFTDEDRKHKQVPIRTDFSDGDADLEARFWMLRKTKCPAVLTENLFQDNNDDVNYLLSTAGRMAITRIHVDGIIQYINKLQNEKH